jgi:4-aminobutyrate aminotransferase-like enzyme/Ser/Thr protein kinase RdoA (MazF antagonist)
MPTVRFVRPSFSLDEIQAVGRRHYGIDRGGQGLPSERDQNVVLQDARHRRYVIKISNAEEDPRVIDLQNAALAHLAAAAPQLELPRVQPTIDGAPVTSITDAQGKPHLVRLLTWVPGQMLVGVRPHTVELLRSLGSLLGTMDAALADFDHPAADRDLKWDPRRAGWIREYFRFVDDGGRRRMVERLFTWAEGELTRLAPRLRTGVIYNDANDHNVLVRRGDPYARRVTSVVDFGDMLRTWIANEAAVACAYAMLHKPDPVAAAVPIIEGYHARFPLSEPEIEAMFPLICSRLAVSVVNSAYQRHHFPDDQYLVISERPAWEALERLGAVHPRFAHYSFRGACGLEPCPATPAVVSWLRDSAEALGPLFEPDPRTVPRVVFDLSVGSLTSGTPAVWADTGLCARKIERRIADAGAAIGIGCYDEVRGVYASPLFAKPGNDGPSARTVHLGLDLFAPPGTPVLAPLDGVVHSLADNANPLDYGPTIVIEHEAGPGGPRFYTLYGHLARGSSVALRAGDRVHAGAVIARIGAIGENGGWPPHLHFQLITDLLDLRGDFPGVADPAERRVWRSLAPDPNLVAQIPGGVTAAAGRSSREILESRQARIGPSLSVSYQRPLTIVRGWMQYLFDADGRTYLDAVNNVPHVGHCHPRVVEAGRRQMAVLNTNTRYLHGRLVEYAERLCATLPEPLRVCYFVNSGSEANELALRLARTFTGSRETIVVDVGYHGNTNAVVEISPYKFNGPGGAGAPAHVHAVPTPDLYRGIYRDAPESAGARYAAHVAAAADRLAGRGARVGAFIAESILSCAGQIVLPAGYLRGAYEAVRAAGGVCIADEVQVGFGRCGTHFWAFETQGVVPDIVTMGKPIGNGHPLGAVVTTPEIARAFANGMEYFNTYGGNPVSCAIGLAVLDVIRDEGLQAHALEVGEHLLSGLRGLRPLHPRIGDVRGLGLFAGIELVRDDVSREPAGAAAGVVANRMRDQGVLVSTDGPFHNVLKIKPPMCFTARDADHLVSTLDGILREGHLQR